MVEAARPELVERVRKTTNKGDQHMKKTIRFVGLDVHQGNVFQMDVALVSPGRTLSSAAATAVPPSSASTAVADQDSFVPA
jgi:hypothetical protein